MNPVLAAAVAAVKSGLGAVHRYATFAGAGCDRAVCGVILSSRISECAADVTCTRCLVGADEAESKGLRLDRYSMEAA